jgi:enamine deaminase RidA (YjgF/YER057c/UK114 family)
MPRLRSTMHETIAPIVSHGSARRGESAPAPAPPSWVWDCLGADPARDWHESDGLRVSVVRGDQATLVTVLSPDARVQDEIAFHRCTLDAYHHVHAATIADGRHVVRMWNHVPRIHDPTDGGRDRYMVFNAARFGAMSHWFGGADRIAACVPAASGVGHRGDALVVHALATIQPGIPVQNPRQVPSHHYSSRYGPLPPCFARATRVDHPRPKLLISGTAAISGEDSMHDGDLGRQFALVKQNLRALIRGAGVTSPEAEVLTLIDQLRVYVPRDADRATIEGLTRDAFVGSTDLEFVAADLCRAELLVEIEGVAHFGAPA